MSPADRKTAQKIWPRKMPLFQDDFAHTRLAERQKAALVAMGEKSLIFKQINIKRKRK